MWKEQRKLTKGEINMTKEEKLLYQEGFKDGFEAAKQEFKKVEYVPYTPYIPWNPYYPYYPYYNGYDKWTCVPYVDSSITVVTGPQDSPNSITTTNDYLITYTTAT